MYSWTFISLLSLVTPALSVHVHPRHGNNDAVAHPLGIRGDAVFPPQAARDLKVEERGLLGGVGNLVGGALTGVATILDDTGNVVATVLGAGTGATTTILAGNPVLSSSSPQPADPPPAATPTSSTANGNGNSNGNGSGSGNGNGNNNTPGTSSAGSNNNGNANNGNNGSNNSNAGGSALAPVGGNSLSLESNSLVEAVYTGTFPVLITDHEGHTHTVTGTGAITLIWVTTLPNGVVSTVTEVITPTVTAIDSSPTDKPTMSPARIAAIVGTVVTIFLIVFILAFVLLLARKKRKAMQPDSTNRDSSMSFGTSDMVHADNAALLHSATSIPSFHTAQSNIDDLNLEFPLPLPPVPSAAGDRNNSTLPGMTGSSRPISMSSQGTFDLLERRSQTSLIADRNFYRKIGRYPETGTYTPFAVAPSSEYNPSEEGHNGISPSNLSAALGRTKSVKSFHEVWRGSKIIDPSENPFNDPSPVAFPPPAASFSPSGIPGNQSRPGLWRKATFGSSKGFQPSIQGTLDNSSESPAYTTADSSHSKEAKVDRASSLSNNLTRSPRRRTSVSVETTDYETATESQSRHTSESASNFSYHSAFAKYANENENPFAEGRRDGEGAGERANRSSWRPMTAKSTADLSVMNSSAYSSDGNRDTGSTPDPKDLFYRPPSTDRPDTGSDRPLTGERPITAQTDVNNRISEDSKNGTSEGEKTIRQTQISYPSLSETATGTQGATSTWRLATTR